MPERSHRPSASGSVLGRRIAWRSLIAIGMACFLVMVLQVGLVVRIIGELRLHAVQQTVDLVLPGLANAAWQINETTARIQLQSLLAQPGVIATDFTDESMRIRLPADNATGRPSDRCDVRIERTLKGMPVGMESLTSGALSVCYVSPDGVTELLPLALWTTVPLLLVVVLATITPARLLQRMVTQPIGQITEAVRNDQSILEFQMQRPLADKGDEIDQLVAEIKGRTERLLAERGLADKAFQALNDGLVITGADRRVLRCNDAARQLLPEGDMLCEGASLVRHVPSAALQAVDLPFEFETEAGRALEASVSELTWPGQGRCEVFLFRDQSLKKQLEANQHQANKMSALGALSGGVAHDFNNLLMTIGGNAELIGELEPLSVEGQEMVRSIRTAARQGAVLTSQLLSFARKQHLKVRRLKPAQVVSEVFDLSRRTLGGGHRVELELSATHEVEADATFLETALLNLLVNARDAAVVGSVIHLRVDDMRHNDDSWVRFCVINQGPTIENEVLQRMGEPFFTTKPKGRGTGLGLSMVFGFAEQSGGFVTKESRDGVTSVAVVLPAAGGPTLAEPPAADTLRRSNERPLKVLLVDDDAVVLQVLGRMLQALGHDVTRAFCLDDVRALVQSGRRWDVVLSDMVLDGATGLDIAASVTTDDSRPALFFISGNVPAEIGDPLKDWPSATMLQKPIDMDALHLALSQASGERVAHKMAS